LLARFRTALCLAGLIADVASEQENKEKQLKSVVYIMFVKLVLAVAIFGLFDLSRVAFWRSLLGVTLFALFYDLSPLANRIFRMR